MSKAEIKALCQNERKGKGTRDFHLVRYIGVGWVIVPEADYTADKLRRPGVLDFELYSLGGAGGDAA